MEIDSSNNKFIKIVTEFTNDLYKTFPDYSEVLNLLDKLDKEEYHNTVYCHCKNNIPQHFFNILYENKDMFNSENNNELYLLPDIDFIKLWNEELSENTRSTIWKYLQLLLFTVISDLNEDSFGETAKLFEAINQDEFKEKIEETINNIDNIFNKSGDDTNDLSNGEDFAKNLPNAEELNEHINKLMNGKLGSLAKEIADETANDLDLNLENADSVNGVFKELFKNPGKLMNLVKNVGSKLDKKLKSGEIKESELLEEASELMNKMKDMPGAGNLESIFKNMGMPGMPNGGKVDLNQFNTQMKQNIRMAKMRDRMRNKLSGKEDNTEKKEDDIEDIERRNEMIRSLGLNPDGLEELVYKVGETPEKSKRQPGNKKKKQGKKKNK
tara:strand:- start:406 stop:1557 length:1152 start_codon:yes stop_codon:yes gene_type:complete